MFQEVKKPIRLYEKVADQIENAITRRELKVNERLPSEDELSKAFDVSKRTLREAIRVVEQKGLVELTLNGTYVKEPSTDKLAQNLALLLKRGQVEWRHIYQYRSNLDATIAGLAAENATDKDIAALESMVAEGNYLLEKEPFDWQRYVEADIRIHLKLARMTGNPIYEWILGTFLENMNEYFDAYLDKENNFSRKNWQNMNRLVQAIKDRQPQEAARQAVIHLELGSEYFGGIVEATP
ncbi:GntR family transcriptional regulator [Desulfosarcina widdelii]|uniref:GntR family transcriptional regulator n=1 Tax=Desulfosarcina widdelii TaxID=947919 RepID=A0A5K7YY27_9BACT|nr:FCD domain-containing protein [Desulfosarcina widdelii]BBO73250.1 GntR family transcriptional regulator [Desulfosarcina widdelii]